MSEKTVTNDEAKIIEVREDGTIVPIKSKKKKKKRTRISADFKNDKIRLKNKRVEVEVDGLIGLLFDLFG